MQPELSELSARYKARRDLVARVSQEQSEDLDARFSWNQEPDFQNLQWGRYQTLPLVPKVPFFSDIDDYQSFQVWGYKPRGSPCELYTLIITCQGHISNVKVMSSHL